MRPVATRLSPFCQPALGVEVFRVLGRGHCLACLGYADMADQPSQVPENKTAQNTGLVIRLVVLLHVQRTGTKDGSNGWLEGFIMCYPSRLARYDADLQQAGTKCSKKMAAWKNKIVYMTAWRAAQVNSST